MSLPVEVTNVPAAPTAQYSSSAIALYGVPLTEFLAVPIYVNAFAMPNRFETALIYGYSYQGHCYSMPEPVALVVEKTKRQPLKGCGYGSDYLMWVVEKLDTTVLIQTTGDTFEELVLRRNLGAAKQPVSYHSAMQMAHRGGKLIE